MHSHLSPYDGASSRPTTSLACPELCTTDHLEIVRNISFEQLGAIQLLLSLGFARNGRFDFETFTNFKNFNPFEDCESSLFSY